MKVSIEILYHCRCDECGAWWSVGDRVPIEEYCPNCGWKSDATEIKNGRGEDVLGVYWDYPLHPKPPIDPIDIAINKVDDAVKTCDKVKYPTLIASDRSRRNIQYTAAPLRAK